MSTDIYEFKPDLYVLPHKAKNPYTVIRLKIDGNSILVALEGDYDNRQADLVPAAAAHWKNRCQVADPPEAGYLRGLAEGLRASNEVLRQAAAVVAAHCIQVYLQVYQQDHGAAELPDVADQYEEIVSSRFAKLVADRAAQEAGERWWEDLAAWAYGTLLVHTLEAMERDGITPQTVEQPRFAELLHSRLYGPKQKLFQRRLANLLDARAIFLAAEVTAGFDLQGKSLSDLTRLLDINTRPVGQRSGVPTETLMRENHFQTSNSEMYFLTRDAVAKRLFGRSPDTIFPAALLRGHDGTGIAKLIPPQLGDGSLGPAPEILQKMADGMFDVAKSLGDRVADVLDLMTGNWLEGQDGAGDAVVRVDDLLEQMGRKRRRGAGGRSSGYRSEERLEIQKAIRDIANIEIEAPVTVYEPTGTNKRGQPKKQVLHSRGIVISDWLGQPRLDGSVDATSFVYRPGKVFGAFLSGPDGRQVALMHRRAVEYDPYRQKWEKRLVRYLSYIWRTTASKAALRSTFTVRTLMEEAITEPIDAKNPSRTRERLEKALDQLLDDGVIAAWQYERWNEKTADQKRWIESWLTALVIIEWPPTIQDRYHSIGSADKPKLLASPAGGTDKPIGERLRQRRRDRGLSQLVAAEQIGIAQSILSRYEKGQRLPTSADRQKLERWLAQK